MITSGVFGVNKDRKLRIGIKQVDPNPTGSLVLKGLHRGANFVVDNNVLTE